MPRQKGWTIADLERAVARSRSLTDVIRQLGLRPAGGNHKSIRQWIERLALSTDHFDPAAAHRGLRRTEAIPLEAILITGSTYQRTRLKRRLYDEGIKDRRCELCGQDELWRGQRISLILDHINGVADDNRLENLRIVCPNCAATLDTHCGRKNQLEPRRCALCEVVFRARHGRQRFCSKACAMRAPRPTRGRPQPTTRKVERPSYEELLAEVREHGFLATGRKFGVSDNAVRKWITWYDRERTRREQEAARPASPSPASEAAHPALTKPPTPPPSRGLASAG